MTQERKDRAVGLIETGNLVVMDPDALVGNNPTALIVNQESYTLISSFFSPGRYDPPQFARVKAFEGSKSVSKPLLIDGNTRTIYVSGHKEEIAVRYPDFQFVCRDVTDDCLQNPKIVPPQERHAGQTELTMEQYLRAVVPPTIEHVQIAPERIAAHLINTWDNMVGEPVAERLSALASLNILADQRVPTPNERLLSQYLDQQSDLLPQATSEEIERVKQGLLVMASVIRQAKLDPGRVAREAFALVGRGSSAINGEAQARREIFGLLHTRNVERILENAYGQVGEREERRLELGEGVIAFAKRSTDTSQTVQLQPILIEILNDPRLTYADMANVFSSEDPAISYRELQQETNRGRLQTTYQAITRGGMTEEEEKFVDLLGRKTHLEDGEIPGIVAGITAANEAIHAFEEVRETFSLEISTELQAVVNNLFTVNSVSGLRRQVNELRSMLHSENSRNAPKPTPIDETQGRRINLNSSGLAVALNSQRRATVFENEFARVDTENLANPEIPDQVVINFDAWWRTATFLTAQERIVMERVLYANEDLVDVGRDMGGLTQLQILSLMISSFRKRHLSEPQKEPQLQSDDIAYIGDRMNGEASRLDIEEKNLSAEEETRLAQQMQNALAEKRRLQRLADNSQEEGFGGLMVGPEAEIAEAEKQYQEAKQRLIVSQIGTVRQIAREFSINGFSSDDLVQIGSEELIEIVERWDYRISRLSTFAGHRIRGAFGDVLRASAGSGGRAIREDQRTIRQATETLIQELGRDPTDAEIEARTGINPRRVSLLTNEYAPALSLEQPLRQGDESNTTRVMDVIEGGISPEAEALRLVFVGRVGEDWREKLLTEIAMAEVLNPKEFDILKLLIDPEDGTPPTFDEIAEMYGISKPRITQITSRAFMKLRQSDSVREVYHDILGSFGSEIEEEKEDEEGFNKENWLRIEVKGMDGPEIVNIARANATVYVNSGGVNLTLREFELLTLREA